MMNYVVKKLSRVLLRTYLEQLIIIDEPTLGEKWDSQHFFLDLPGKWECSWLALDQNQAVGFVITSIKPEGLHVHRIAVASSYQGRGLGRKLLHFVALSALQQKISLITLRVAIQNDGAIKFYNRLGFERRSENTELLDLYIKPDVILRESNEQLRLTIR